MLRRLAAAPLLALLLVALTTSAAHAAEDDGSTVLDRIEDVAAKGVDAVLVRPVATIRVVLGAAFMVPAGLFSLPNGRDGLEGAYEILIDEPVEYAFVRELGEF